MLFNLNSFFYKIFSNFFFFNFLYKWNPLFKQYSYYGYLKSNGEKWNYSKTEELKKFKF